MALIIVPDDFPTIQQAINASVNGGSVGVRAGVAYAENITDNGLDGIELFSIGGRVTIDCSGIGGVAIALTRYAWLIDGFHLLGAGGGSGLRVNAGGSNKIQRCTATGWGNAFHIVVSDTFTWFFNCAGWGNTGRAFYAGSGRYILLEHCGAFNNTLGGFQAVTAGTLIVRACLAGGNGVDFVNASAIRCAWNVSADLTAPGSGVRTGFNMANIINNYQLAAAGENGANIAGTPLLSEDVDGNIRERDTLIFYAGAHDPYVAPTGGAPTCLGAIDAAPAAQGCILVRFFEMVFDAGTVPYRYDIHVKQLDDGVLTKQEIDDQDYYARSVYQEDIAGQPDTSVSPPIGPAIVSALIAFEAYSQHADNIHLFTNRQYQVAVRAIAIDATDTIYEDDNEEVVISYSSGYQGIQWMHILSWPCVQLCDDQELTIAGIPNLSVGVTSTPPVEFADDAELDINVLDWPQLDAHIHRNRGG